MCVSVYKCVCMCVLHAVMATRMISGAETKKGLGLWGVQFLAKTSREYSNFGLFNTMLGLLGALKQSVFI